MLGLFFFYKKRIEVSAILGTIIGGLGILLLFSDELFSTVVNQKVIMGIIIGLVATFSASLGNMASIKNHQAKIPVMVFNAWSMLYGSLFSLLVGLVTKANFSVHTSFSFYASLIYLSVFGTVIAFYAYQTLIIEIGAHKAAYTSIISPIIAVFVSMYFEEFKMTWAIFGGMVLAILGNYLVLAKNIIPTKQKSASHS
jgi:drug/metabolite transporter (DMT)-like permease